MIKFFTVVLTFCSISFAYADDYHSLSALNTKNLVRMKLWYEGVSAEKKVEQNHKLSDKPMTEELKRALDKVSL
jgi:hypothetical protein